MNNSLSHARKQKQFRDALVTAITLPRAERLLGGLY